MITAVVNTVQYIPFYLLDSNGDPVTGKVNANFTKSAYLVSTPSTTATATVTENASGTYRISFTPSVEGTWHVTWVVSIDGEDVEYEETVQAYPSSGSVGTGQTGPMYCTLAELRARMNIPTADTGGDATLEACIESASRAIDGFTGRRFYQITATARTFTAEFSDCLYVPDLVSVSALVTDTDGDRTYEVTWATTDYDLSPFNASDTYYPYTRIEITPQGRYGFPVGIAKGVKVTGTWGWPAVPDAINEATLIQAARYAKRMAAPFGLDQNTSDTGQAMSIPSVDPDVKALIAPYRLTTIGAV